MRIRTQDLLLGVIMLLGLPLAPQAYTLNNKNGLLMHPPSRLSSSNLFENSKMRIPNRHLPLTPKSSNLLSLQSTSAAHQEEMAFHNIPMESFATNHDSSTATSTAAANQKRNFATWVAVAALFLASQFMGGKGAAATAAGADKGLLYSAVSATFLRRNNQQGKVSRWLNVPNLVLALVLLQGFQQVGHLSKGLVTLGGIFSSWYMGVLHQFPLITKSVTTAAIGVMGDTAAQCLEERIRAKKEGQAMTPMKNYDKRRGLAILGDSILISGPLLHIAYDLLESAIPVAGPHASLAAMAHVLIDNFVLDAIFVAVMFVSTGIAEGYAHQIIPQLKKDYVSTMKAGWATSIMLMPLLFVCFRFLPLNFRVLGMNIIDIFWEAIISYMVHRRRRLAKLQEEAEEATSMSAVSMKTAAPVLATEMANI
jgi:Mpv17 / PMP22 family